MAELSLYLIRHAQADARGPAYPDDSVRPLVPKGVRQAKLLERACARLDITFDRLFSSPFTRAAQTAEPLAARLRPGRRPEYLDRLADDAYGQLLADLAAALDADDQHVACVGHEPYLGELVSLLLTGDPLRVSIRFRKAAMLVLTGELQPGAMSLEAMLPMRFVRRLLP